MTTDKKQEPVAWRTFDGEGGYDYRTYDMNENYAKEWDKQNPKHKGWVEPLYTSPQPAQRQEPVLWLVNGVIQASDIPKDYTGCLFTSTQPPQSKPWVSLTEEEIHKMTVLMGINPEWKAEIEIVRSIVRNLEAKLKEKNA